jgi:hypothetical protein
MDESAEKFVFLDGEQKQGNRLLDRMDRALVNAGRAIWRCMVDGFASYAAAEFGILPNLVSGPTNDQDAEMQETPRYPYYYGTVRDEDLRSDFTDIDELIRALQTAGD